MDATFSNSGGLFVPKDKNSLSETTPRSSAHIFTIYTENKFYPLDREKWNFSIPAVLSPAPPIVNLNPSSKGIISYHTYRINERNPILIMLLCK